MILKTIDRDIIETNNKHIAFPVNIEGINIYDFAGRIARSCWPELIKCGNHELGTVISKKIGNITYHALVCYSIKEGWGENQTNIIKECFDSIPANGETISSVAIGQSTNEKILGANFEQIVYGIHKSNQNVDLYTCLSLESIFELCNVQKSMENLRKEKLLATILYERK